MKRFLALIAASTAVVGLSSGGAAGADVTLAQRVVTRRPLADGSVGRSVGRRTIRLKGRKARSDDDDSGEAVILLLDSKRMYTLDMLLKTFRERNFEELKEHGQIKEEMLVEVIRKDPRQTKKASAIDQLSDGPVKWQLIREELTGDWRKRMLEKYHLPEKPAVIEVKRTEETKYICNYKCTRYIATEDGEERSSAWVTEDLELEPELYEFLEKTDIISPDLAAKLKTIKGLPLAYTVSARDGRVTDTTTLAVDRRKVDKDHFEIPKGFRKEEGR